LAGRTIRIAEHRAVLIGGALREAGELVDVSVADAKTLIADGYATDKLDPPRPKPKRRRRTRKALDLSDEAEVTDDPGLLERG
jgi:hypothetical protein